MFKSYMLEIPTPLLLDTLGEEYEDVSDKFNFKTYHTSSQCTPDILIHQKKIAIELKNWNNTYTIGFITAIHEILSRYESYPGYRKELIISNPRWERGVKEYLMGSGVEIYELGEFVDGNNPIIYNSLKQILATVLGYRRITRSIGGFLSVFRAFLLLTCLSGLFLLFSILHPSFSNLKSILF